MTTYFFIGLIFLLVECTPHGVVFKYACDYVIVGDAATSDLLEEKSPFC
ncbi:MAG: hypothetical protein HY881_21535 [Deltaproteobacteria bacterium]|nr:hypothetical protein [Deltaproteobacteria bacterium]